MSNKPILQLNAFPVTLDPARYANAKSTSNPNGSFTTLYAFRNLVDPIPEFTQNYVPSDKSTEAIYNQLINGASVTGDNSFATQVLSDAQKQATTITFANMDGTPGLWRPVYTSPENWYDTSGAGSYKKMNLEELVGKNGSFNLLQSQEQFQWYVNDSRQRSTSKRINFGTKIHSIWFKCLIVQLIRPWLNTTLFETSGWFLSGQPRGYCSSGRTDKNHGIIPLLPTSILVGTQVEIVADWHPDDQKYLEIAKSGTNKVSFGPFLIEPKEATPTLQLIGWVSSLIPFSPQIGVPIETLKWIGKTMDKLKDSLSTLYPLSIVIKIENYTNITLKKIYEDKKYGVFEDNPLPIVEAKSSQGFSTYTPAFYGPEGWVVYSFDAQYNVMLYWENPYTGRNNGSISFIPTSVKLTRENLESYRQENNKIKNQGGFLCDATIGSGFKKAIFSYTIIPR